MLKRQSPNIGFMFICLVPEFGSANLSANGSNPFWITHMHVANIPIKIAPMVLFKVTFIASSRFEKCSEKGGNNCDRG